MQHVSPSGCLTRCFVVLPAPVFICPSTTFPKKNPTQYISLVWIRAACASDWERTAVFSLCDKQQPADALHQLGQDQQETRSQHCFIKQVS